MVCWCSVLRDVAIVGQEAWVYFHSDTFYHDIKDVDGKPGDGKPLDCYTDGMDSFNTLGGKSCVGLSLSFPFPRSCQNICNLA